MNSIFHFYLTFNPYLNQNYESGYTQAHEFYDFLKSEITKESKSSAYWGKIISKERESNFDLEKFNKILILNKEQNLSTHLFITDFQNIWVGKVRSVTDSLPKGAQTLPFYQDKKVEVWFEIEDFFLLEHNNDETANKLAEFFIDNEFSEKKINGLSPFTTSVKYPCIIQDLAEEQFFDEFDSDDCSHLIFKNNPAIMRSSSSKVLQSIHAYVFPEEMYAKLPHTAKLEIEAAEMDMLESRHHNIHKMTFSYLKILEIVMNDLIVHHIKRKGLAEEFFVDPTSAPPRLFFNQTKDYFIPLKQFNKNFSINNLLHFIDRGTTQNHSGFQKAFADHKSFIRFCTKELDACIRNNKLIEIRNGLAHGEMENLTLRDAMAVRSIILGCGGPGIIYSCYKQFYSEKFAHLACVTDIGKTIPPKKFKLVG